MATVTVTRELTPGEIEGMATTAAAAVSYWAEVHDLFQHEFLHPLSDDVILFWVTERDGEGGRRDVTPRVLADGIARVMAGVTGSDAGGYWADKPGWQFEPRLFADMDDLGAMDADEADWVVQLGLFGHLVFG